MMIGGVIQLWYLFMYVCYIHCVKSVQIRSNFWSVFSRIRTEYGEIRSTKFLSVFSPNAGKYGIKITPYLDTFHPVDVSEKVNIQSKGLSEVFY